MKLYIAGPMSGLPQYNYPAFDAAATALRQQGHEPVNPAEMDSEETRALALASPDGDGGGWKGVESWGDFLARDVKLVADQVDGIVVLPGWEKSRGARLEAFVALTVQKPVYIWCRGIMHLLPPSDVVHCIMMNVIDQGDVSRYNTGEADVSS